MAKRARSAQSGASVAMVVHELQESSALYTAQVGLGSDGVEVLNAMFKSVYSCVEQLTSVSGSEKVHLTSALTDGPWTADQKGALARVILGVGSPGDAAMACSGHRRKNQRVPQLENYIPEAAILKLKSKALSRASREAVLSQVIAAMGVELPCQRTLYRAVAILNYYEAEYGMSEADVQACMDRVQQFVKQHKRRTDLPFIVDYPHSPEQLPQEVYTAIYPAQKPVDQTIPELESILNTARMRGREPGWLKHVPEEHRKLLQTPVGRKRLRSKTLTAAQSPAGSVASEENAVRDAAACSSSGGDIEVTHQALQRQRTVAAMDFGPSPRFGQPMPSGDSAWIKGDSACVKEVGAPPFTADEHSVDPLPPCTVAQMEAALLRASSPSAKGTVTLKKKPSSDVLKRPSQGACDTAPDMSYFSKA